jgi:hypothetical protein
LRPAAARCGTEPHLAIEEDPPAMRPIQRAAVTGLFAIWLAPLSAGADAAPGPCCRDRPARAEAAATPRPSRDDARATEGEAPRD